MLCYSFPVLEIKQAYFHGNKYSRTFVVVQIITNLVQIVFICLITSWVHAAVIHPPDPQPWWGALPSMYVNTIMYTVAKSEHFYPSKHERTFYNVTEIRFHVDYELTTLRFHSIFITFFKFLRDNNNENVLFWSVLSFPKRHCVYYILEKHRLL